jgi:hypothetical protein
MRLASRPSRIDKCFHDYFLTIVVPPLHTALQLRVPVPVFEPFGIISREDDESEGTLGEFRVVL